MGNYSIIFKGIYCDSEMTSDQASNSDEYYLITTVWADLGGNKVTSKTTKVPGDRSVFTDVDDGESRKTEVLLYSGPARKVVVGTQLYEEDFGDADATTQGIAKWAKAVEDLAEGTEFTLPEAVSDRIPEIVNYIFDLTTIWSIITRRGCSWKSGLRSWRLRPQSRSLGSTIASEPDTRVEVHTSSPTTTCCRGRCLTWCTREARARPSTPQFFAALF